MSSDIQALIDGFNDFKTRYAADRDGRYRELAEYGPHSKILMIACCDSRVDPAIITNSAAGDLMVIRNIANLVPPYDPDNPLQETQAALDFAVCYLGIEQVIVMGHSRCGGIRSLLNRLVDDLEPNQALDRWTKVAEPAAKAVLEAMPDADLDEKTCACSRRAVVHSLKNLEGYPAVAERLERGKLQLHGWYFNLSDGDLQCYNPQEDKFESL